MNLRTLKKLSKRAAPYLPILGDDREQFRAESYENYHHAFIGDRKHWERRNVRADVQPRNDWTTPRGKSIVYVTRKGHTVLIEHPSHPRKGTIMVGATTGYYEPEWDEQCAWSALKDIVRNHFTNWDCLIRDTLADFDVGPSSGRYLTRDLSTVSQIFRAADEMVATNPSGTTRGALDKERA